MDDATPGHRPDPLRSYAEASVEGDNVAVAELVRRTQAEVWSVCAALGSVGETEDLVQETYLRALRALPAFRGDAPVKLWLLSIARRTCADHVRRRQRQRRLVERLAVDASGRADAAEDVSFAGTLPPASRRLLAQLDPDRREAFVLTQVVGLSYEEAAAVAGCPIGTIRSRVARARSRLLDAVAAEQAG